MSWWAEPLTHIGRADWFDVIVFDMGGVGPIGYTLFAVALGVFAGTVWQGAARHGHHPRGFAVCASR